ncbi:hypothetical protein JWS14_38075 [Rhodococcus koreensis]|nr:hypothetical protein JWS14_38075 [Rhodococcus koreensis]
MSASVHRDCTWTGDIAHSTRVGGRTHRSDRPAAGRIQEDPRLAIERGYELSSRGRIPAEIEQGFHHAH